MKKSVLVLLIAFMGFNIHAQKYFTKTGVINFFSHTDIEDIKAENRKVVSALDSLTGALEFSLLMKGFDFPNDLMEQHFNESYAESSKYPKAGFKGKVTNMSAVNFAKDGSYTVNYTGKLTIKDVTKDIKGAATIVIKGGKITAKTKLDIKPSDYHIVIPAGKIGRIADVITVNIIMDYKKQ